MSMSALLLKDRWARLAPLILWCAVIFAFSEMPGNGLGIDPPLWYVLERKTAHIVEYAILAILSYRFFAVIYPLERFSRLSALVMAFGLAYGALDEFHQVFVFGRGARLTDVFIDGIGLALALVSIFLLQKRRQR